MTKQNIFIIWMETLTRLQNKAKPEDYSNLTLPSGLYYNFASISHKDIVNGFICLL